MVTSLNCDWPTFNTSAINANRLQNSEIREDRFIPHPSLTPSQAKWWFGQDGRTTEDDEQAENRIINLPGQKCKYPFKSIQQFKTNLPTIKFNSDAQKNGICSFIKLTFGQCPAIHTNYRLSNCTTSN